MTKHPRLLARIAGLFYLTITASALFAYMHVRSHIIIPADMPRTVANLVAQDAFYRLGFSAAVATVLCNPPMGVILYELLKVVNRRLALLALVFITISTTIEAVNLINYITPLVIVTLPEYQHAFDAAQIQALIRGPIRLWAYMFSTSLAFFAMFCGLNGYLIVRSRFLPAVLGVLMMAACVCYLLDSFGLFLVFDIPYLLMVTLVAENALALWLLVFGVNEAKWFAAVTAQTQA
jgi:hypothetical protein